MGLLAWMVPRGAAQYDPCLVLFGGSLPPEHDRWIHADPYLHRLVDADHFGHRSAAVLHSGLSRHPLRRQFRDSAGTPVDDPADLHRHRLDFPSECGEPRRTFWISAARRFEFLLRHERFQMVAGVYRVWLLADVERNRNGGGCLLHR